MTRQFPEHRHFQLIDADYFRTESGPVIRLFGKTDEGKSICCHVPGFQPYFYVNTHGDPHDIASQIQARFPQVRHIETISRFEPVGYQQSRKPMLQVFTHDPGNVPEIRDEIAKMPGVKGVYEADILFRTRYLIDKGLHGMAWLDVGGKKVSDRGYACGEVLEVGEVAETERRAPASFKYLAFDIECLPKDGNMPTPDVSPVIMVSLSFEPAFEGKQTLVLIAKPARDMGDDVEACADESALLQRFFDIFRQYDPDVVTGYNCNAFDVPYITERLKVLNNPDIDSAVGRDRRFLSYRKVGTNSMVSIPGRIVMDALPIIRQQFSLKRYTLRNVSRELLDREKLDVPADRMEEHWKDDGDKLREFVDYARRDSELALELVLNLQLLDKYIALAQVSGTVIQDVISGGQTNMVEQLLLTEFGKQGRVMSSKPSDATSTQRRKLNESLKGGAVLEPCKGLHENVLVLDYKSLYPTIIMAHNLCYTTVVRDGSFGPEDVITSPTGARFVKPHIYRGIVPEVLEYLLNRRTETKKEMKQAKDENEYRVLDATQLALKILLNSFYGYSGYARARLYSLEMAGSVTAIGRENISRTEKIVCDGIGTVILKDGKAFLKNETQPSPQDRRVALSVVYGDTDSVFVHCFPEGGGELSEDEFGNIEAELVGKKVASIVTRSLPDPMELEFEAFAKRVLLIAKKRYAQWLFEPGPLGWEDKIKVKGLETVRRDWCELTSRMLNTVLEYVLKEGNVQKAVTHVRETVDRVRNVDVSKDAEILDDLVLTKRFSKSPSSYKNRQPHLTVVEKQEKRTGVRPSIGERIPFVIIAGKGLFVDRAEDPEYVKEHNIQLDVDYYIQKQLLNPVERILGVFGVDIATLDHDSRQKGLFDFAKTPETTEKHFTRKNGQTASAVENRDSGNNQSSLFDF
jgi:DNA polymerase I